MWKLHSKERLCVRWAKWKNVKIFWQLTALLDVQDEKRKKKSSERKSSSCWREIIVGRVKKKEFSVKQRRKNTEKKYTACVQVWTWRENHLIIRKSRNNNLWMVKKIRLSLRGLSRTLHFALLLDLLHSVHGEKTTTTMTVKRSGETRRKKKFHRNNFFLLLFCSFCVCCWCLRKPSDMLHPIEFGLSRLSYNVFCVFAARSRGCHVFSSIVGCFSEVELDLQCATRFGIFSLTRADSNTYLLSFR